MMITKKSNVYWWLSLLFMIRRGCRGLYFLALVTTTMCNAPTYRILHNEIITVQKRPDGMASRRLEYHIWEVEKLTMMMS
jgi:hypothetical protein